MNRHDDPAIISEDRKGIYGGDGTVGGSASTAFTFDDMQLEQPRVPVLLSVADTIKLEIDFNLVRQR